MLRTLLIAAILFFVIRYAIKLMRPAKPPQDTVQGRPKETPRGIDQNQIEDAEFKDIPEK